MGETTEPKKGEWNLGFSYADFVVWHTILRRNSSRLCCFDASTGQFKFTKITYPARADMEDGWIKQVQMATKTLAIICLGDLSGRNKLLGVDISNPNAAITVWESEPSNPGELWIMEVANWEVRLWRSEIPTIEIYDATDGSQITTVNFPTFRVDQDMAFEFFLNEEKNSSQDVGQELKVMPFQGEDGDVQIYDFKARRASSIKPRMEMALIAGYCRLGPTEFLFNSDNTYKIFSSKDDDDSTVTEIRPTSRCGYFALKAKYPKGPLHAVKSSSRTCFTFSRFDLRGRETTINIESKNFKPKSSQLNFDTLISHSAFKQTRCLEFVSFASDGGFREVMITFLPPSLTKIKSLRIQQIICLPTAAVAVCCFRRDPARKTVFVVLDFKPE